MYFVFIDDFVVLDLKVRERSARGWFTSHLEAKPRHAAVRRPGANLVPRSTSIQGYVEPHPPPRRGFEGRPAGRVPEPEGVQVQGRSRSVAVDSDVHEAIPGTQLTCDRTAGKNASSDQERESRCLGSRGAAPRAQKGFQPRGEGAGWWEGAPWAFGDPRKKPDEGPKRLKSQIIHGSKRSALYHCVLSFKTQILSVQGRN